MWPTGKNVLVFLGGDQRFFKGLLVGHSLGGADNKKQHPSFTITVTNFL
jgi:hypothetical protein